MQTLVIDNLPDICFQIALFSHVENTAQVVERCSELSDVVVVDASLLVDIDQVQCAAGVAALSLRRKPAPLEPKELLEAIIYALSPSRNLSSALQVFSPSSTAESNALAILFVNASQDEVKSVLDLVQGQAISDVSTVANLDRIKEVRSLSCVSLILDRCMVFKSLRLRIPSGRF
jgi:hypothetical protein